MSTAHEGAISIALVAKASVGTDLLTDALAHVPQFRVVARLSSYADLDNTLPRELPDVLLLSYWLLNGHAFTTRKRDLGNTRSAIEGSLYLRRLTSKYPTLNVIALLDRRDEVLVLHAFRSGVHGIFYPSESTFDSLCRCITVVHQGHVWASGSELRTLIRAFSQTNTIGLTNRLTNASGKNILSRRQEEVVRLVAQGLSNREIARELNLSEHTVKNYMFRIFDIVGVSNRTELANRALKSNEQ
jgi:DNA-binding NarL/FixJ family response regulator